jgi:DNA invertase Pin-like site-specific DNA recombinase
MATPQRAPICYAYGRHSTHKQDLTEQVQADRCHDYWQRELASKGVVWGGFFYDRANSARKKMMTEREQGRIVFAMAQPGDHLVVTRLDRGFRSLKDGLVTLEQLGHRGVKFHSIFERIDTSTAHGVLIRNVLLSIAQFKSDLDSERTKESIAYLKSKGLPYSNTPPMGWRVVVRNEQRVLRINQREREFCEMLAEAHASGASFNTLALWCWKNGRSIDLPRDFGNTAAVRHAVWAKWLDFPKVAGRRAVYALLKESGKV